MKYVRSNLRAHMRPRIGKSGGMSSTKTSAHKHTLRNSYPRDRCGHIGRTDPHVEATLINCIIQLLPTGQHYCPPRYKPHRAIDEARMRDRMPYIILLWFEKLDPRSRSFGCPCAWDERGWRLVRLSSVSSESMRMWD